MIVISKPPDIKPAGGLYLSSVQQSNLVSGNWTKIQLNAVMTGFIDGLEDTGNYWILIPKSGLYLVTGQVTFSSVVDDKNYGVQLRRGVGVVMAQHDKYTKSGYSDLYVPISCEKNMAKDDVIMLYAQSNAGVDTVDVTGTTENRSFLTVQQLR